MAAVDAFASLLGIAALGVLLDSGGEAAGAVVDGVGVSLPFFPRAGDLDERAGDARGLGVFFDPVGFGDVDRAGVRDPPGIVDSE